MLSTMRNKPDQFLSFCQWSNSIAKRDQTNYEATLEKSLKIERTYWYYANESESDEVRNSGDIRLENLLSNLKKFDSMGFQRSINQVRFHNEFIIACLKKIYGQDLYRSLPKLVKEFNLIELPIGVIVHMPRRHGKTMGTAMYAAAYLVSQPRSEMCIYSTGRRASKMLLDLVKNFVHVLLGEDLVIIETNIETLSIQTSYGISTCRSYPSKQKIDNSKKTQKTPKIFIYFLLFYFFLKKPRYP